MNFEYVAIAITLVVAVLLANLLSAGPRKHKDCRYRRKRYLLSKAGRSFYGVLRQAAGSESVVFCKVRVADVLAPARGLGNKTWRIALNRIVAKHFDFVLCDPESLIVKGVREVNGTDDPRNGLAMSHTTHWAFDKGVFTISDQYEILVHPEAYKASQQNFALLDLSGQQLKLPKDESFLPHQEALLWHRTEVFGNFLKS